jgi:hypothetical protein
MLAEAWHAVPPSKGVLAAARGLAQLTAVSLVLRPTPWGIARRLGLDGVGSNPATWGFTLRGLASSQAGVALSLLGRLDAVNAGRRSRAERISRALVEQPGLIWPQGAAGSEPIYMRLPLLAEDYETRERLVTVLGSRGIGAGRLYSQPLHRWYPDLEEQPGSLLGSEAIAMRLFTLPTHSFVTDAEIERMAVLVSNCCQELSRPGHGYGSSPRRPARLLSSGRECGQSGG